jgi:esterase/lipase superfamily enzyme
MNDKNDANYWMISNRAIKNGQPSGERGPTKFFIAHAAPLDDFQNWHEVPAGDFKLLLLAALEDFPALSHGDHERQNHVTFFIHGYNNGWQDAARRYQRLTEQLYSGDESLGICLSFDWPSLGSVLDYLPDREHARACATDLAEIFSQLYDWLLGKQTAAINDPSNACRAKVSVMAHSMGNYLLQKALASVWTRKNQPLLVSLINQLVMIAADVDNDLFELHHDDSGDGAAMANLSYRITALFSGRDAVLGASAGLKHFGSRRLGRSGLAFDPPTQFDNVWAIDCSHLFPAKLGGLSVHSEYFENAGTLELLRQILIGTDRNFL